MLDVNAIAVLLDRLFGNRPVCGVTNLGADRGATR